MNSNIKDLIIPLAVTAGAYLSAFVYECGYASHFNIPLILISVDLKSLLPLGGLLIAVICLMIQIVCNITQLKHIFGKSINKSTIDLIKKHTIIFAIPLTYWILSGATKSDALRLLWLPTLLFAFDAIPIIVIAIILTIAYKKPLKSIKVAVYDWNRRGKRESEPNISSVIKSKESKTAFGYGVITVIVFMIAFSHGQGQARGMQMFLMDNDNYALIQKSDNYYIFKKVDMKNRKFLAQFKIIKKEEDMKTLNLTELKNYTQEGSPSN